MLRDLTEPSNLARIAAFTVLSVLAVFPALLAVGALSNLGADYKDSTDTTYLLAGGVALAIALVPALLAIRVLWGAPDSVIASSMVVGAIVVAAFVFYLIAQTHQSGLRQIKDLENRPVPAPPQPFVPPIATVYPAPSLPPTPFIGAPPR